MTFRVKRQKPVTKKAAAFADKDICNGKIEYFVILRGFVVAKDWTLSQREVKIQNKLASNCFVYISCIYRKCEQTIIVANFFLQD